MINISGIPQASQPTLQLTLLQIQRKVSIGIIGRLGMPISLADATLQNAIATAQHKMTDREVSKRMLEKPLGGHHIHYAVSYKSTCCAASLSPGVMLLQKPGSPWNYGFEAQQTCLLPQSLYAVSKSSATLINGPSLVYKGTALGSLLVHKPCALLEIISW